MRGVEFVVGALILATGVVAGPGAELSYVPDVGFYSAELTFEEIDIQGQTRLTASDGAFLVDGAVRATITAPWADVQVYNYTYVSGDVGDPTGSMRFSTGPSENHDQTYQDVRITIRGTSSGLVQGWADPASSAASFDLVMAPDPDTTIRASSTSTPLTSASGEHRYSIGEPVYALSHHGAPLNQHDIPFMTLGAANFQSLSAHGSLVVLVEEADVTIEHSGARNDISLRTEDWFEADVLRSRGGTMTHLALSIPSGSLTASFEGTKAIFLAPEPALNVTGALAFRHAGGSIVQGDVADDVSGDRIDAIGNTTMLLSAEGDPDAIRRIGPVESGSESHPTSRASVQSLDGEMTVDGRLVAQAPVPDPSRFKDEATFVARLVGAVLMAWAAIRWGTVLVAGMVARKPLANPRRQELFDLLRAQGLAHVRDLHRATGIPLGTLVYHLGILRQAKLVRSIQTAGYRVYFVPSVAFCHDEMRRLVLVAEPTRRAICGVLLDQDALSQAGLAQRLSLSHSQVAKQLKLLVAQDLVERRGSRNARYVLTDLTRRWFAAEPAAVPVTLPACGAEQASEAPARRRHTAVRD